MTQGTGSGRVYLSSKPIGWYAAGYIAGGVIFLLVLLVQFVLLLASTSTEGDRYMPGLIGGLSVFGIALIARGAALLRSIRRVVIDQKGLRADGFISSCTVQWEQVHSIRKQKKTDLFGGKSTQQLALLDERQKLLVLISEHIERFTDLVAEVEGRSSAALGRPTADPALQRQHEQRKGSKTRRFNSVASALLAALFAAGLIFGIYETLHVRKYATEGVRADARIVRHYMVRVTPHIEYSFKDSQGRAFTRETSVEQPAWEALQGATKVPIEYLASNPDWNRLAAGEMDQNMFGGGFMLISGGGLLLFGAILALTLLGLDLRSDNGRLRLVRYGEVSPANTSLSEPVALEPPALPVAIAPMPAASPKPTGLIVLGVIAVIFGVLGAGRVLLGMLLALRGSLDVGNRQIVFELSWWHAAWNVGNAALAICLILTGVGLVMLRPWARSLAICVAILQVLSSVGAMIGVIVSVIRSAVPGEPLSTEQVAIMFGGILGETIGMIFPLVLLVVCVRRTTAEALRRAPTTLI